MSKVALRYQIGWLLLVRRLLCFEQILVVFLVPYHSIVDEHAQQEHCEATKLIPTEHLQFKCQTEYPNDEGAHRIQNSSRGCRQLLGDTDSREIEEGNTQNGTWKKFLISAIQH